MKKVYNQGQILIQTLVFGAIAAFFISGLVSWFAISIKASRQTFNREQAVQIAEAGIDYYRWHLAHSPQDFKDGTVGSGPYTHNFSDKDGNIIGQFILDITPPPLGSTLVTIKSTGKVNADMHISRSITVKLAKPSIAKYAVAANDAMRFGEGTEVFGPIHSNQGIRFDGLAHNIVSSAVVQYDDPDSDDCNNNVSFGVHTCVNPHDPSPPASVPNRTDIFETGRQFPVPALDFTGITADLAQMKSDAQAKGFYRSSSGSLGYHIVLKINDTFDLYSVTNFVNPPSNCTNSQSQSGWGSWSIQSQSSIGNFPFPANGIMFFEDNVFVDGKINTARLTIIAASFPDNPSTRKSIIVNNDVLYTNYDGQDTIGLIAQRNINVGMMSEDDLRIDAALIAQNGRVGRYYYSNHCSSYIRQKITSYGMIATSQRYGFAYTDGTGYQDRYLIYDANLLYGPPPSFPLTSDQYVTISWEETK
jgi:hypothetical protein